MIRLLYFFTILLHLFVMKPANSADLQKGAEAFERGEYAIALREWMPLAKQGDAYAQHNLGVMYRDGLGVPQDYKVAVQHFIASSKQGHLSAILNLGEMNENGLGIIQNQKVAFNLYSIAADQGLAMAQYNLGLMHWNGRGIPQDRTTAASWFKRAADQEYPIAQRQLGQIYLAGLGVPQDILSAFKLFKRSAELGDAAGQFYLALMYARPENLPDQYTTLSLGGAPIQTYALPGRQDYTRAFIWSTIAAEQGHKKARKLRDMFADKLPLKELNKAKFLLRECINRSLKSC